MHKSRLDGLQPYVRDEFAADEAPARPAVAHEYELLLGLLHGLRPFTTDDLRLVGSFLSACSCLLRRPCPW